MEQPAETQAISKGGILFYILVFIAITYGVYHFGNIRYIGHLFRAIKPFWIFIAILAQVGTYLSAAYTYRKILGLLKSKLHTKISELFKLSILVVFINQAIPTGTFSGNAFLFRYLVKRGLSALHAVSVIVMEILTYYFATLVGLSVALAVYIVKYPGVVPPIFILVFIVGYLFYGALFILVNLIGSKRAIHYLIKKFSRFNKIKKYFEKIATGTDGMVTIDTMQNPRSLIHNHKKLVTKIIGIQFALISFDALTVFALLHGFGVSVSLFVVFVGFMLTHVVAALPISPGSLIVFEGSMTLFYTALGIPIEAALVITLVYRALSFWMPMVVGIFLYRNLEKISELKLVKI